jgi:hypothetical protein
MSDGITPLTPGELALQEAQAEKEAYLRRALIGLDMFINVLTDGDPDETISSRSARAAEKGKHWGVFMAKFLDVFQHDHGAKAQAGDVARAQAEIAAEDSSGGFSQ